MQISFNHFSLDFIMTLLWQQSTVSYKPHYQDYAHFSGKYKFIDSKMHIAYTQMKKQLTQTRTTVTKVLPTVTKKI